MTPKTLAVKREEAEARQEDADERTPEERLDLLDERLGKDVGAARERRKLTLEMNARNTQPAKRKKVKT